MVPRALVMTRAAGVSAAAVAAYAALRHLGAHRTPVTISRGRLAGLAGCAYHRIDAVAGELVAVGVLVVSGAEPRMQYELREYVPPPV